MLWLSVSSAGRRGVGSRSSVGGGAPVAGWYGLGDATGYVLLFRIDTVRCPLLSRHQAGCGSGDDDV